MFRNFTLKTLLYIAFGSILALLMIISLISFDGLNGTKQGFIKYRELARATNLSGRVQANMLAMRLSAMKYLNKQSPEEIRIFKERQDKMAQFLEQAHVEIKDPARARLVDEIVKKVHKYEQGFDEIVHLYQQRHKIVSQQLDPSGLAMRKAVSDIIISAYEDADNKTSFIAARLQEHLLLGRLYVTKFLVTNSQDDAQRAEQELNIHMAPLMQDLDAALQASNRKALLDTVRLNYDQYKEAFAEIQQIINGTDQIPSILSNKAQFSAS